jgi:hypothetical protein
MANVSYWMLNVRKRGKRNEPVRLYLPQRDTEIVREGNKLGMLSVVGEGIAPVVRQLRESNKRDDAESFTQTPKQHKS